MKHKKSSHYSALIKRMDAALESSHPLEAIWYAYALIEDRLISILNLSGGSLTQSGEPIINLGRKLKTITKRHSSDRLLETYIDTGLMQQIRTWAKDRNDLIHAMASAAKTMPEIDSLSETVAKAGTILAYTVCRHTRRLKNNRHKLPKSANPFRPK